MPPHECLPRADSVIYLIVRGWAIALQCSVVGSSRQYRNARTDAGPDALIWSAYRYSNEMGKAVEAVLRAEGNPTPQQVDKLYRLLKRNAGKHLSQDLRMALLNAVRLSKRRSLD